MTSLLECVVGNFAISAAIGGVAWMTLRFARRPTLAHALFLVAIAKLVSPSFVEVSMPALPAPRSAPRSDHTPAAAAAVDREGTIGSDAALPAAALPSPHGGTRAAAQPAESGSRSSPEPADTLAWRVGRLLAGFGWLLGSALTLRTIVRRTIEFARATRVVRPAPDWLQDQLRSLLPRFGLRRAPAVWIVDADIPPAVFPVRGGHGILFPAAALVDLSAIQVQTLLAHELAHVRRRDPWVRVFEAAVTVLWWWLPLLWLLRAGLRQAEERSCDAWVSAALPDCRTPYCRALLHVAASDSPLQVPVLASPVRRLSGWKTRLEDIMCHEVPHRSSVVTRIATAALSVLLLPLAIARSQEPDEPRDVNAKLAVEVDTRFVGASLDEWSRWLATATEVPFDVDASARAIAPQRTALTELRLPKMPARRVLDVIGTITGLGWRVAGERIVLEAGVSPGLPTVRIADAALPHCYLLGAVRTPGVLELKGAQDTLIDVMFRVGWRDDADLGQVTVIRPGNGEPLTTSVNFRAMLLTGITSDNLALQRGDIVFVPPAAPPRAIAELPPLRLAIGSRLQFVLYDETVLPGAEQLRRLAEAQTVGRDGKIFVPYVGHVEVVGKSKEEVAQAVRELYRSIFKAEVRLDALFLEPR
ncbi:MAG TPA: M56 family metallopeptidase [Planctomycetota bacterium]|nr:M56 family metallopeptidase [Planctomycetota bacterium]